MPPKLTSAIIGGVAGALTVAAFQILQYTVHDIFGIVVCLAYLVCGLVAVWHYTNEHEVTLTGGEGVTLGMLAGVVGGLVSSLLSQALLMAGIIPSKEEAIELALADVPEGAEGAGFVVQMMDFMYGWGGMAVGIVIGVLFGLIGGAIGRAIWKRGEDEDEF